MHSEKTCIFKGLEAEASDLGVWPSPFSCKEYMAMTLQTAYFAPAKRKDMRTVGDKL